MMKYVHTGTIKMGSETVCIVVKPKRQKLLFELNNWLFDYSYANNLNPLLQLPPLDDWTHSPEDHTYWYVKFPEIDCTAAFRVELLEF